MERSWNIFFQFLPSFFFYSLLSFMAFSIISTISPFSCISKRVFKDHVRIHFSFQMKPQIRSREKGTRREAVEESGGNVVSGSINHLFCLLLRILNVPCLWCRSSAAAKWKSTRSYIHPRQVYVPQNWRVEKRAKRRFSEQNNQIALIWQSLVHDLSSAGRITSC